MSLSPLPSSTQFIHHHCKPWIILHNIAESRKEHHNQCYNLNPPSLGISSQNRPCHLPLSGSAHLQHDPALLCPDSGFSCQHELAKMGGHLVLLGRNEFNINLPTCLVNLKCHWIIRSGYQVHLVSVQVIQNTALNRHPATLTVSSSTISHSPYPILTGLSIVM